MRRRRRRRMQGDVELNLAAMLDMAFQLLAFFILTFKPSPLEGQIALRMPTAQPVTQATAGQNVGSEKDNNNPLKGIDSVIITALSNSSGDIAALRIEQGEPTTSMKVLEEHLITVFGDPDSPFHQVVLNVGSGLKYEHVMQLLDVCTRIKLHNGEQLNQLSFSELPEAHGPKE